MNRGKCTIRLEEWHTISTPDSFLAPELRMVHLVGKAYGDPDREDGTKVRTSHIFSAEGKKVETSSGTTYLLGEPKFEWLEWMKAEGIPFDPNNPIRVRRGR